MKLPVRVLLLPLVLALAAACAGCSDRKPYSTSMGVLSPGATLNVRIAAGSVTAYAPAVGDPPDRFTISATGTSDTDYPAPPAIRPMGKGVDVTAGALQTLLVRVPHGVNLSVDSKRGDVSATNIDGNADVRAAQGSVRIMLPEGYARVAVGKGNVNVTMGAASWLGTLPFSTGDGDVVLFVNENARFHIRIHTADGSIFTDFDVRGTSAGTSETIDANVNGGGPGGIDVEAARGSIRLLKLSPQP
jgi:hypothetical protein